MQARPSAHYLAYALQYDDQQTAAAYDALEAELDNLLAALDQAEANENWAAVRDFTWAVMDMLGTRGYWAELLHRLDTLGTARREWPQALALYQRSLEIMERIGVRADAETVRQNLERARQGARSR